MKTIAMTRSAAALAAAGAKLHTKEEAGLEPLVRAIETNNRSVDARLKAIEEKAEKANELATGHQAHIREIEQIIAGRDPNPGYSGPSTKSAGQAVVESDEFKAFGGSNRKGRAQVLVKTITTAPTSAGAMVTPDRRPDVVALPQLRLTIRDLLAPGNTSSNSIEYARQSVRTNAAGMVAEGALKPESDYQFDLRTVPVRTIAHWVKASRQSLDDAPMLRSVVDSELLFGLKLKEEGQFLFGDGTGQNLLGIVPQATLYQTTRNRETDTRLDVLAHALAQAEAALIPATGIVLNVNDLEDLKVIKDGDGRYIGGGPFGGPITNIWGRPVVGTPSMPAGTFIVGAFKDGAQIFDRWDAQVEISTENSDDFVRNLCTILAEERVALAVRRPDAFVAGSFPA